MRHRSNPMARLPWMPDSPPKIESRLEDGVAGIDRAQWDALVADSKFSDMPGYGKAEAGYIALQDHGDPVWYRNIRVREL